MAASRAELMAVMMAILKAESSVVHLVALSAVMKAAALALTRVDERAELWVNSTAELKVWKMAAKSAGSLVVMMAYLMAALKGT